MELFSQSNEEYILKVMFNRPKSIVEISHKLKAEDFIANPAHKYLFTAIKKVSYQGDITAEGIMALFENENPEAFETLKSIGGAAVIERVLRDSTLPESPAVESHIQTLKSFSYRRNAIKVAEKIMTYAQTNIDPDNNKQFEGVDTIDNKVKELTYGLASSISTKKKVDRIGSKVQSVKEMIANKEVVGISIHGLHPKLNTIIKALRNKALYVFGAPEKTGKSTLMADIGYYVAKNLGIPVGYADTEMTEEEMILRLVSKESGVPEDNIVNDNLQGHQIEAVEKAFNYIQNELPFYHFNANEMTNNELESEVKLLQLEYGIGLFIYDYVKIQSHEAEKGRLDMIMAAKIDTLKEKIAKQCDIPVITSGQMEKRNGVWKFWESSHFTKLADVICVLFRNDPTDPMNLGSHSIQLLEGRKVNSKDIGRVVNFDFRQDIHRIIEL